MEESIGELSATKRAFLRIYESADMREKLYLRARIEEAYSRVEPHLSSEDRLMMWNAAASEALSDSTD